MLSDAGIPTLLSYSADLVSTDTAQLNITHKLSGYTTLHTIVKPETPEGIHYMQVCTIYQPYLIYHNAVI